jgi:DNA-binding GntR family transcriptional regulator
MEYGETPRYQQLAGILREQIEAGELRPGMPIPSKMVLKQTYSVAGSTIDKAVRVLKDEGKVVTVPGLGIFVRERKDWH